MIIQENNTTPENQQQMLSAKEEYLSATSQLIRMFKRKLTTIKNQKQPKSLSEQFDKIIQLYQQVELDQQPKNQDDQEIESSDIQNEYKTLKQNQIIQTSQKKIYKCSCHKTQFKTPQGLGGHMKWMKNKKE